jgi:hypothetical protein
MSEMIKKNYIYNIAGTVPKFNRKIVERNTIDPPTHEYKTAHFPGLVWAIQ